MHSTTLRRAMTAAVAVPVLALSSAACGGDDGDDGGKGKSSGGSGGGQEDGGGESSGSGNGGSSGEDDTGGSGSGSGGQDDGGGGDDGSGAPPPTKAQLAKALLKTGDVKGYKTRQNTKDALPPKNTMEPDKPECEAITDAVDSKPEQPRTAYVSGVLLKGDFNTGSVIQQVLLAAYKEGDAAKWLDKLNGALNSCQKFEGKVGTGERAELEIERGKEVGVGDDSVQFTMKDAKGKDAPTVFTVVRAGNSTATFMSIGISGKPVPIAGPVVAKQHEKLTAAGTP